mmetsp:Transcript_55155/g.118464  ORF Transcript_55155/g.118464 Transcript_55155/m.118464 type:complete len:253 (+) Transcript_55155:1648-2406(+)
MFGGSCLRMYNRGLPSRTTSNHPSHLHGVRATKTLPMGTHATIAALVDGADRRHKPEKSKSTCTEFRWSIRQNETKSGCAHHNDISRFIDFDPCSDGEGDRSLTAAASFTVSRPGRWHSGTGMPGEAEGALGEAEGELGEAKRALGDAEGTLPPISFSGCIAVCLHSVATVPAAVIVFCWAAETCLVFRGLAAFWLTGFDTSLAPTTSARSALELSSDAAAVSCSGSSSPEIFMLRAAFRFLNVEMVASLLS